MPQFPSGNYMSHPARTEAEFQASIEEFLARSKQLPGGSIRHDITISGGIIAPSRSTIFVSPQSGDLDELVGIDPVNFDSVDSGHIIRVCGSSSSVIKVSHSAVASSSKLILRNAVVGKSVFLCGASDSITFMQFSDKWVEVGRSIASQSIRIVPSTSQTIAVGTTNQEVTFDTIDRDDVRHYGSPPGTVTNRIDAAGYRKVRVFALVSLTGTTTVPTEAMVLMTMGGINRPANAPSLPSHTTRSDTADGWRVSLTSPVYNIGGVGSGTTQGTADYVAAPTFGVSILNMGSAAFDLHANKTYLQLEILE